MNNSPTVITHSDADGIICLSVFLKKFENIKPRIYFATPYKLKDTICFSIIKKDNLGYLYVFDLTGVRETLLLASVYKKVLWIDHHVWESNIKAPENIELFLDNKSPSAAKVVGKYFKIKTELIRIANEIDKDNVKSEDARFLRDLIGAFKWKYDHSVLNSKYKNLAKGLAYSGLEKFERDEKIVELIAKYSEFTNKLKKKVLEKANVSKVGNLKVAVYETAENIPANVVLHSLLKHPKAPFDVIAVITHRVDGPTKNIVSKVELRTHTNKNIRKIADFFGGGGHKVASAAIVTKYLTIEDLIKVIKSLEI